MIIYRGHIIIHNEPRRYEVLTLPWGDSPKDYDWYTTLKGATALIDRELLNKTPINERS